MTASATGVFGAQFLDDTDIWTDQPSWAGFVVGGLALRPRAVAGDRPRPRRATSTLLGIEGIDRRCSSSSSRSSRFVQMAAGTAPGGAELTLDVFKVEPGTDASTLFLGIIFGLLSFAGFEAAATLGEEARNPRRDIPRAILGTAIFGGIYFTFVTAVEMMAFGTDEEGVAGLHRLQRPDGRHRHGLHRLVGRRDRHPRRGRQRLRLLPGVCRRRVPAPVRRRARRQPGLGPQPHRAATTPRRVGLRRGHASWSPLIALVCAVFFGATPFDTFLWSGTIGTLILLVAYVLATIGCIKLLFVDRKMAVPMWEVVIPLAALVMLGYTI